MSEPKRIQRKRTKGWRMPENTVYVGRPSRWGNPFKINFSNDEFYKKQCVAAYRALLTFDYKWFRRNDGFSYAAGFILSWIQKTQADVDNKLAPLRGKDLACWCPLDKPCHADILLELANK